jgi:anti-sigma factor RsiW
MNCRTFEDWIDSLASGTLSPADQEAAATHARTCDGCRRLLAAVRGEGNPMEPQFEDELVQSILSHTTGSACAAAEEHLCQWVDGDCSSEDQEIMALHLEHCSSCSAIAAGVMELSDLLPDMAQVDPGNDFTQDVLQATLHARPLIFPAPRLTSCIEWWNRLIRRPRFAWEAAYIGTLFFLLILGNPAIRSSPWTLPDFVVQGGSQILHETSGVLSDRREAARRSISHLEIEGKSVLDRAADYSVRTASSLRQSAFSIFEAMKAQWLDNEPPGDIR